MILITAASSGYFPSLVNMIGSAHRHTFSLIEKIVVYDIGLEAYQLDFLNTLRSVETRPVPPFCPHWRRWFTWKPYCIKDTMEAEPAGVFLWLDAGTEILSNLGEIAQTIESEGYFFVGLEPFRTNVAWTTSECFEILGLDPAAYGQRNQIAAFIMGFRKDSRFYRSIVLEAFRFCQVEKAIAPQQSCPNNRHDQSIFSLLAAKENCRFHDWETYGEWRGIFPDRHQVIYSCRRKRPFTNFRYLRYADQKRFKSLRQWSPIYREIMASRLRRSFDSGRELVRRLVPGSVIAGVRRMAGSLVQGLTT